MTLRSLILSNGSTPGDAARACGVSPTLFDRIDAGRQPLPRVVAERLASLLGVPTADAIVEAPSFTNDASPASLRPVPALPGIDPIDFVALTRPSEVRVPGADLPTIWAIVPEGAGADFVRVSRNDGAILARVPIAGTRGYRRIAVLGSHLWSVGTSAGRASARLDVATLDLLTGSFAYGLAAGIAADPESGTVWIAEASSKLITRVDLLTGDPDVSISIAPLTPFDLFARSGAVYAAARDGADGYVLRIDPVGATVEATSASIPYVAGLDAFEDGPLRAVCGAPSPAVFSLDRSTLVETELVLSGDALVDPKWIFDDGLRLWLSDTTGPAQGARLERVEIATGETVAADYDFLTGLGAQAGRVSSDGVYVWMPDGNGLLRKIHPETLESLLEIADAETTLALSIFV